MSDIVNFIFQHAQHAHWIIFGSFILAGFNLPISEDLLIILSAIIAANAVPENTIILFAAVFVGAYMSDWMVYWIGRTLGIKLWKIKWFRRTFPKKKLSKVRLFYKKYGFFTLLIGRFIPFGVRNCLFLTAGMSKMSFTKFMFSDGIACFISNLSLFLLAYYCGQSETIVHFLKTYNLAVFSFLGCSFIVFLLYRRFAIAKSLEA